MLSFNIGRLVFVILRELHRIGISFFSLFLSFSIYLFILPLTKATLGNGLLTSMSVSMRVVYMLALLEDERVVASLWCFDGLVQVVDVGC